MRIDTHTEFEYEGSVWFVKGTVWFSPEDVEVSIDDLSSDDSDMAFPGPIRVAEDELEHAAAQEVSEVPASWHNHDDYGDYGDYDTGSPSGPDYWVDRESGEWRCG